MNETIEALTKLAQDLTDRVDELTRENESLKNDIAARDQELAKKASAQSMAPSISEKVVDDTLDALVKAGALHEGQREESRKIMLADAEAPHRILQHFLDVQGQTKTASADTENVTGGTLVSAKSVKESGKTDSSDEVLDRMMRFLQM